MKQRAGVSGGEREKERDRERRRRERERKRPERSEIEEQRGLEGV
jgi:hypothetical protein